MSQIKINSLTFAYEGSFDNIFEDVSLTIDTDWKTGFIGRNGRGKTTFLKLLCGEYKFNGNISIPYKTEYFPYAVPESDYGLTALETAGRISPGFETWRLKRELSELELDEEALYRPFGTLSFGERTKLLLALLFINDHRFPLIDEPTNHLDMHARETVSAYLKNKQGFILVSHDRAFLDLCVDHVLSINKTNIEIQQGNYTSWQRNKDNQDNLEKEENERLKKDIRRLSESAKRTEEWSLKAEKAKIATPNSGLRPDRGYIGHKAAKLMRRAKSTETRKNEAVEKKSALLKNIEEADNLKLSPLRHFSERLIEFYGVSISYGQNTVFENIGFIIKRGDRTALLGKNGSGKSSILKLITGDGKENTGYSGIIRIASGLIISYVSQDTSFLRGDLDSYADIYGLDESLFKAILRKLDFGRAQFDKDISCYSDGQKKKVLIAKSLCERAHIYIWDEPLNYVDILSRIQIEDLIKEYCPTMLFVEHDRAFVNNVATGTIELG